MTVFVLFFIMGFVSGVIVTLLTMLVLFAVGYNTIGTLLQIFKPTIFVPTLRQMQKAQQEHFDEELESEDNIK